jgi:hypothetical protein
MQRTYSWSKRNRRVPRIADLLSHDSLLAHVFEIAVEYLTHVVQGHMTLTIGTSKALLVESIQGPPDGVCGELLISPESAIRHTQDAVWLSCRS